MRILLTAILGGVGLFMGGLAAAQESAPASGVRIETGEDGTLAVQVRGEHFTTLHIGEDARIPYLWPVNAEGGVSVTRNWPMGEDEPESKDHPHHRSMWTAFGDVNGNDSWHRTPITVESVETESGEAEGRITLELVWRDRGGEPVVNERRVYRFPDAPASARILDQEITFTAAHGPVTFGENKEGVFALRMRPDIQGTRAGVLTKSDGKQGERAVYGTPSPWMDYSGPIEGVGVRGIAILSHPDNFRMPAWHVRDYGLMAANFFAMKAVGGLAEEGTHALAEGESLTLRVRFLVHSGSAEEADIAAQYAAYAGGAGAAAE